MSGYRVVRENVTKALTAAQCNAQSLFATPRILKQLVSLGFQKQLRLRATHKEVNLARPALIFMPSDGSITTAALALIIPVKAITTPWLDFR
jgi:hypothetical protein